MAGTKKAMGTTRPCDVRVRTGKRWGKLCTSSASFFDPVELKNQCAGHRTTGALPGVGTPWYADREFGCDRRRGHETFPLRRIVKGVRMCLACSTDYALDVELHADDKDVA